MKYRVRQLMDGKFVAELKCGMWPFISWKAIDLVNPEHTWTPSSQWYQDCIGTEEACKKALAKRGL